MSGIEDAFQEVAGATALLWGRIADALEEARREPEEWVPVAPGDTGPRVRELAERSAAADIAMRLRLSDQTVRAYGALAVRLRDRLPRMWAALRLGSVTPQAARTALELSDVLDPDAVHRFDEQILGPALTGTPSVLRRRAHALVERLSGSTPTDRHATAAQRRGVWFEDGIDGMAWLHAHLPAASAHRVKVRLDAEAAALAADQQRMSVAEPRTRDQLRADVAADLLTGDGTPSAVRTEVVVTVPVLALLGRDELPASLDGIVPIDAATARELAADAPSFHRLLTDPIDSAALDLGRRSYRPPSDLTRWVRMRDRVCARPGCTRRSRDCDLDHVVPFSELGARGATAGRNLVALCRADHRLKHPTRWRVTGADGRLTWTSPTGAHHTTDPPF